MPQTELQQSILELLQRMRGINPLKELFWTKLNYDRVNHPLSLRSWNSEETRFLGETGFLKLLNDSPLLLATGGTAGDFHIIYIHLNSEQLPLSQERSIVNRLLPEHPYALFVFSNQTQTRWHFLNVKYDTKTENRQLFRRITIGAGEQLRTATERLSLLDLASISPNLDYISPLEIGHRHDRAFDVEAVTQNFFEQYAKVFARVETLITQSKDTEGRRLFTQKLFNRLMFIAFIQKKGWLKFKGSADYLTALWEDYQSDTSNNFYRERLSLLFFTGLNNPQETDIAGINNGGFLKDLIGTVPYLNGGLFEKDSSDEDEEIVVPDECIDAIFHDLFNCFNFTVTESTPLDVEVAVDPEMLGKVFEELVTGRHESGSYYTPKPIVSFMCREALKGYLQTEETIEAIAQFVESHNPEQIRNPEAVLEALRRVKVCDPACGSGAYLLGMLHELLDLRQCLFATKGLDAKTAYQRKLEIIENNLYGVDIDLFAVNIARLRLWLSLAVEYEGENPPPLPNLKFKIETGDSLIAPSPTGLGMFRDELIRQYREAKARYLQAHLGGEKQRLEKQIVEMKIQIALLTHGSSKVAGFDWAVEFAEVFTGGGFDIIVANPPYVRQELIKELKPVLQKVYPTVYTGTSDLYCFFYGRALQLLRAGGMLAFISSNKWFRAKYGEKLRKHIAESCQVYSITDFGDLPVFQGATAYPMIFIAQKEKNLERSLLFTQVKSLEIPYPDILAVIREKGQALPPNALNGTNWTLTDSTSASRLQKMAAAGVTLGEYVNGKIYRGVLTGFNEAFVIDGVKRAELIAQDAKSAEIIKPLAVGKDIRKWCIEHQDKWLIYSPWELKVDDYPAIKKHLEQWQKELKSRPECQANRYKWWCMARYGAEYVDTFEKPKIMYPVIAKEPRFAFDTTGAFINDKVFTIAVNDLYLLGILNSSVVWEYLKSLCSALGDVDKGGRLELRAIYMSKVPIPDAPPAEREAISNLVQKCLDAKGVGCEEWEREIDSQVAALYGL